MPGAPPAPQAGSPSNPTGGVGSAHTGSDAQDRRDGGHKHRSRRHRIIHLQRKLVRHGYRLKVDGVMGPITRSARAALKTGLSAKTWNHRMYGTGDRASSGSGGGGGNHPGRSGGGGGGGRHGGGGGGKAPSGPSAKSQARAMTQEQFGQTIAQLLREQDRAKAEKAQNIADIADWFNQVGDQAAQGADANRAAEAAASHDFAAQAGDLAHLFGGSANPDLGGAGGMAALFSGLLGANAQAQEHFDNNLGGLIDLQATDQRIREQRAQDARMNDLADQLVSARLQKGYAYTDNLAKVRAELMNQALASQEFGLKVASQQETSRHNRAMERTSWARLNKDLATAASSMDPNAKIFTDPQKVDQLRAALLSPGHIVGNRGGMLQNPGRTYNRLGDELRARNLDPSNKAVAAWRNELFRQMLNQTQRNGYYRRWSIRSGGRVFLGKKFMFKLK